MTEQELQNLKRQVQELLTWKKQKEIQQVSYPLDEVSRIIINTTTDGTFLDAGDMTVLTIASGVITPRTGFHEVDTEGAAASDDLDTISYSGIQDGAILVLRAASSARTVVLKDDTGNLRLNGDFSLDHNRDTITLIKGNAVWYELARSGNDV